VQSDIKNDRLGWDGNCATIYLPILKEFEERRAKTRAVL